MRRIRIDWHDLAVGLGVSYVHCPSDDDVLAAARQRAHRWAQVFERARGEALASDEILVLQTEAEDIMRCHWSPSTVVSALLNMSAVVDSVNEICRNSPPPPGRPFAKGDGMLSWRHEPGGVRFNVAQPLVRAYVAVRQRAKKRDDGAQLRDIAPADLVFTMRQAHGPVVLDLAGWDHELDEPNPDEVVRFVSRRRSRQKSGQVLPPTASSPRRIAR